MTALVGSSGSGKSTIIGLIAAFYVPTQGAFWSMASICRRCGWIPIARSLAWFLQDSFLFDGTIRENVAFSRPDASEEDILRACRIARVDDLPRRLRKYDTIVGERGVKLSGGQRQRISIARAILADPRILILDEATSSLDSESEALIQEGLAYLMRGRTTFVIAHRLSTIRRADQILVVERGRIVERGTHEPLYAPGGRYYDLYTKQHGLERTCFSLRAKAMLPKPRSRQPQNKSTGRVAESMARPERFELPTYSSGGCRSIQLSYGRVIQVYIGRLGPSICARKGARNS